MLTDCRSSVNVRFPHTATMTRENKIAHPFSYGAVRFPIFIGNEMRCDGGGIGNQDDEYAQAAIESVFPNASTTRAP